MAKTATKTGAKRRPSTRSLKKNGSARPTRSSGKRTTPDPSSVADQEVTIDRRRGERRGSQTGCGMDQSSLPAPQIERRQKVNRRRQIDPTTCERDYSQQEVEFMNALDDYKRRSGRMFPTCSEVLEVLRALGYVKLGPADLAKLQADNGAPAVSAKPMPADWQSSDGATSVPEPVPAN